MALLPVQRNANDNTRHRPDLTRLVDSWPAFTAFFGDTFTPVANVTDADDAYLVVLDLPDTERDAIEVAITDRRLTVTGSRTSTKRRWFRQRSRQTDRFAYEVVFPRSVEEDQVTATLDGASLTVRAPKSPTERRRRIEIQ